MNHLYSANKIKWYILPNSQKNSVAWFKILSLLVIELSHRYVQCGFVLRSGHMWYKPSSAREHVCGVHFTNMFPWFLDDAFKTKCEIVKSM